MSENYKVIYIVQAFCQQGMKGLVPLCSFLTYINQLALLMLPNLSKYSSLVSKFQLMRHICHPCANKLKSAVFNPTMGMTRNKTWHFDSVKQIKVGRNLKSW